MQLEISTPDRWHLRLPAGTALPDIRCARTGTGRGPVAASAAGRGRSPLARPAQRRPGAAAPASAECRAGRAGLAPVNSLWLWGGGALPPRVHSDLARRDQRRSCCCCALAARAGIDSQPRTPESRRRGARRAGWSICRICRRTRLAERWWPTIATAARRQPLLLHFTSGERWQRGRGTAGASGAGQGIEHVALRRRRALGVPAGWAGIGASGVAADLRRAWRAQPGRHRTSPAACWRRRRWAGWTPRSRC